MWSGSQFGSLEYWLTHVTTSARRTPHVRSRRAISLGEASVDRMNSTHSRGSIWPNSSRTDHFSHSWMSDTSCTKLGQPFRCRAARSRHVRPDNTDDIERAHDPLFGRQGCEETRRFADLPPESRTSRRRKRRKRECSERRRECPQRSWPLLPWLLVLWPTIIVAAHIRDPTPTCARHGPTSWMRGGGSGAERPRCDVMADLGPRPRFDTFRPRSASP